MPRPTELLAALSPRERRTVRRAAILTALLPLSVVLAVKLVDLTDDPILNTYGIAVLTSTMAVFYIAFTRYDDPTMGLALVERHRPLVTCLVAVHNDEAVIGACIESMLNSTWTALEVIVIDDASTDGTPEVLRRFADNPRVQVLTMPANVGKKRALAAGAERADGQIFVFTDSDSVLEAGAVEQVVLAFAGHPELGAVSGHARALNADANLLTRIQDVWYDGQFGVAKAAEATYGAVTCVSGPLAAFRRTAVIDVMQPWADDRFLGREFRFATDRQLTGYVLRKRVWKVGYVRSARVWTNVPATFRGFVRQQVRWKKSFVRNLFFTGRFHWRRGLVPSLLYYGHVLWVAAAPVLVFRHLVWLPSHHEWTVTGLYLAGVVVKGGMWGLAYRVQNPGDSRWVWRPAMSLLSAVALSWLLPYSILTLRRSKWSREESMAPPGGGGATRSAVTA